MAMIKLLDAGISVCWRGFTNSLTIYSVSEGPKLGPWVDGTEVPFDIGSNLIVPSFFMDKANTELPPKIHMSFFSYFAEWQVD